MELHQILPQSRIDAMTRSGHWQNRLALDYLEEALARAPDSAAITDYNGETGASTTLSYEALDRLSRRFALALRDLGVGRGDVVALQLPNWWQLPALHLACLRIGAISNPLMPIFRERELGFMLGFAEAKVAIAPARFRGFGYPAMYAGLRPELPKLAHVFFVDGTGEQAFEPVFVERRREDAPDANASLEGRRPEPDAVIELMYTSGTTGQPKGVMHTSNTLLSSLAPWIERLRLSREDVVLMASPLAHQTGFVYGSLLPIMLGGQAVLQDRWNPSAAAALIQKHRVSFTMAATPFLNDLAELPDLDRYDVGSLRIFVSAGAPIPPALVERAQRRLQVQVLSGWGMTEVNCATVCLPGDPPEKIFGTDGRPLPGLEVRVVDAEGRPLPPGAEGLLKTRGAALFVGYLKRPDLYGVDDDGWFDTGDIARLDGDGYIRISGRAKDIIIRGGENIPVVEVEGVLFRHPAIMDVAVVGAPDPRLGERACAFVTLRPGASLSFAEMVAYLEDQKMAKPYFPEKLVILDEMPRTPSGKIQKFVLRERVGQPEPSP